MEIHDLKSKIKTLSSLKVSAKKNTFLKGYEDIFLSYGAMCEFIYDNFDEFEVVDVDLFASLGDAIADVYNRLKSNKEVDNREINLLNTLLTQYSDNLTSLYGYVSPFQIENMMSNLQEEVDYKLSRLRDDINYLDTLYLLYKAKEIHNKENSSTLELCDLIISYIKSYESAITNVNRTFTMEELEDISNGLDRAEQFIIKIRVIIVPINEKAKSEAISYLQDSLVQQEKKSTK